MRILIAGAGIAGLTLAALLRQRGEKPEIVEQRTEIATHDYMLGISPLGSRVLYGLQLMDAFLEKSVASDHYAMCTGAGETIHQISLQEVYQPYGPNRACTRGQLLRVLKKGCEGLSFRMGITITALAQQDQQVSVTFSDGTQASYDLVVGADGGDSVVRDLILKPEEISHFDTGWGGWLWWTSDSHLQPGTVSEFWGSGYMLGVYPTEYRFGVFAVVPAEEGKTSPYSGLRSDLRQTMSDLVTRFPQVFEQIPREGMGMTYWPIADARASVWYKQRVVLVGDSAAGFLPTSAVGASMAMESAAVLADELTRVDASRVEWALQLYQTRRKPRVEAEQEDARDMARGMFVKSAIHSHLRNLALQRYSTQSFADSIKRAFEAPI